MSQEILTYVGLFASIISICLGLFALWQASNYKTASEKLAKESSTTLLEIREQTKILQEITAKQLDKLLDNQMQLTNKIVDTAITGINSTISKI